MAKESKRDGRWKKLRITILNRDGWTCTYCGDVATEVDHIIPLKRGGSDDPDNLTSACRTCNIRKKDNNVGVFLAGKATPPVFRDRLSPIQSKPVRNNQTRSVISSDSPFLSDSDSDQSGAN